MKTVFCIWVVCMSVFSLKLNAKPEMVHLEVVDFDKLNSENLDSEVMEKLVKSLLEKGLVAIRGVPQYQEQVAAFIEAARKFSKLSKEQKMLYEPNRETGDAMGYELGAEKFKDVEGRWLIDDKKASYYAAYNDKVLENKWPTELDLQTPYMALANTIFITGSKILHALGLDERIGLVHENITGWGRMLHYHKEGDATNFNPYWCGAHFDHSVITGLIPAFYFQKDALGNETAIPEPEEAGLFIVPTNGTSFVKVPNEDKSILLFQVGEFGQLISNDRIKATKHTVKKANEGVERFTFALFFNAEMDFAITPHSVLTEDERFSKNQINKRITYKAWHEASLARYLVR